MDITADECIRWLFSTEPMSRKVFNRKLVQALFVRKNPQLLRELQRSLESLFERLIENEHPEILIARGIALLPFLDLQEQVHVPQYMQGAWRMVRYEVKPLFLTPAWLGSPLAAYLLTHPSAPALLLFKGTPPPTSLGHFLSIWTDFTPGFSVGELAFRLFAKSRLTALLQKQKGVLKAYGQSLGGSLALLTASYLHVDEVHAFAPAPLFKRAYSQFQEGDVSIYWHVNDPVPFIGGGFHSAWKFYEIEGQAPQNKFLAHLRCVVMPCTVVQHQNCLRKRGALLPLLHFLVSIPVFCVTTLLLLLRAPFYLWKEKRG